MDKFVSSSIWVLGLYFLPSIIAVARKTRNYGSVVVVNLFLGWTIIGWIIALAMAVKSSQPSNPTQSQSGVTHGIPDWCTIAGETDGSSWPVS